jgi:hypothetical protein
VKHRATRKFWAGFERLPVEIRRTAMRQFAVLKKNPVHPSLHFKRTGRLWSVRVSRDYGALAVPRPNGYLWIWIGPHSRYDQILNRQ